MAPPLHRWTDVPTSLCHLPSLLTQEPPGGGAGRFPSGRSSVKAAPPGGAWSHGLLTAQLSTFTGVRRSQIPGGSCLNTITVGGVGGTCSSDWGPGGKSAC